MAQRIKKRAKNVSYNFDKITKEGMLIRGAIYLKYFMPSFSYRKKINSLNKKDKEKILEKLEEIKKLIIKKLKIRNDLIAIDDFKLRLLTSHKLMKKIKSQFELKDITYAIVEEYPTADAVEMNVEFL